MENIDTSILFILSIGVFGGLLGGWLFQKIKIPQVVGYIAIGLLLGESGLGLVRIDHVRHLRLFNFFALGIIGFLVGGELKLDMFKRYGRQFTAILLGEGLATFILVTISTTLIIEFFIGNFTVALAAGVVLGAIASATDPASTIDVLWEYRARGVLTTSIIAIVALDDALAMTLYGLGTSCSQFLTSETVDIGQKSLSIAIELGGAVVLGALAGLCLTFLLKLLNHVERSVAMAIGIIMLVISTAVTFDMDVILAAMTMGFALTNLSPHRSERLFSLLRSFSIPIYVIFFVLVGARLRLTAMPNWLWGVVAAYVIFRSVGKVFGARLGAGISSSPSVVKKYLGTGLFAQGGVAIGLSILASQSLSNIMISKDLSLGAAVISVVTATTLLVQVIGPSMVKLAIRKAGETDRNVTEEDILAKLKVDDILWTDIQTVPESASIAEVTRLFQHNRQHLFPVVGSDNKPLGVLGLRAMKDIVCEPSDWNWLIAADVMLPIGESCRSDSSLSSIYSTMLKTNMDQMLVLSDQNDLKGIVDRHSIRKRLEEEVLANSIAAGETEVAFA